MDLRSFLALLLLAAAQHMTFGQFNCGQTELAGCESVTFTLLPGEEIVYTFGGDPLGDSWSSDLFVEIHDGTGAQCIYFAGYNDCNLTSECDFAGELGAQSGEPGSFEFNTVDLLSPLYPWTITVHNAYANSSAVSYQLSTTCPTCGPLNCIEVCPGDDSNQLYLPVVPQASGTPAVWACATPSNYILADNQTCAADVVASDAYCTENSWDALCQDAYDACPGCTDPVACNFDPFALVDDGSCLLDVNANGVCDVDEVYGCTDESACNYDASATTDGSLSGQVVTEICTGAYGPGMGYFPIDAETYLQNDALFINGETVIHVDGVAYIIDHVSASVYGNECNPTTVHVHIVGGVINTLFGGETWTLSNSPCLELDECGVCGGAGIAEGTCDCDGNLPEEHYTCDGTCVNDTDGDGTCDELEVLGCTNPIACNYDADATEEDGSCSLLENPVIDMTSTDWVLENDWGCDGDPNDFTLVYFDNQTWEANTSETGTWSLCDDLHMFYGGDGDVNATWTGTWDGTAFVGTGTSSFGENTCFSLYPVPQGCMDPSACNYDADAMVDDGSCLVDLDDNGICDVEDVDGCTNPNDCNYNPDATSEGSFFMEVVGCNENQSFPNNYVMVSRSHFEQNVTRFVNRETILSVDGVDYLFHHHLLSNCDEILLYISPGWAPGGLSFGMNDQVLSPGDLIEVRNTPCQSLSFCTECDDAYVAQSVALSTTLLPDVPEVNVWTENYVYTSLKNSSTNVSYLLTGDEIAEFKQGGTTRYYELTTGGSEFENGIVYFDGDLGEDFEGGFLPGSFVRFFIPSEDCSGIGCTNPSACNFSSVHVIDDGSCLLDVNANGVCDVDEVYGCTDDEACNYSPDATTEGTLSGTVIMNECDNQYQFNYFGIDADVYFQNQNLFIPGESMIEVSGQMYLLNSVSLAVGNECNPTNVLVFIGGNVSGLSFAEPLVGGEAWTLTNGPCASETYCGTCGNDYLDQSVARATSYLDEDEPPTWRGNYLLVDEPLLLNTEGSFAVELEQDGLVRFYYIYGYNTETGFIYLSDNNFCSELSAPLTSCSAFLLEDFEGGFRPGSIVRFIAPCCDDLNQNGTCDAEEGCTYSAADNYNALATVDDGSCQFASSNCPADIVPDGFVQLNDLLALLQQYGLLCSEP